MICWKLLLCVSLSSLGWAQEQAWNWTCDPVVAQQDVDIKKVVGRWFVVEEVFDGVPRDLDDCTGIVIDKSANGSEILFSSFNLSLAANPIAESINMTATVVTPSQWLMTETTATPQIVVDLPSDGRTLTVSSCVTNGTQLNTLVLAKEYDIDRVPIKARLEAAGIRGINDHHVTNFSHCPTSYLV